MESLPNLVGVLELYDLAALEGLRARFPGAIDVLTPRSIMGERDSAKAALKPSEASELARVTLEALVNRTPKALSKLRRRLKLVAKLGLTGDLVALFGSAGVLAAATQLARGAGQNVNAKAVTTAILAAVALIGAVISTVMRWLQRDIATLPATPMPLC